MIIVFGSKSVVPCRGCSYLLGFLTPPGAQHGLIWLQSGAARTRRRVVKQFLTLKEYNAAWRALHGGGAHAQQSTVSFHWKVNRNHIQRLCCTYGFIFCVPGPQSPAAACVDAGTSSPALVPTFKVSEVQATEVELVHGLALSSGVCSYSAPIHPQGPLGVSERITNLQTRTMFLDHHCTLIYASR